METEKPLNTNEEGNYLLEPSRRSHFIRAGVVGILAGAVAVAFQVSLDYAEQGRMAMLSFLHSHVSWGWVVLPVIAALLGGIAAYLTSRFAPAASGSGIPHIRAVTAR